MAGSFQANPSDYPTAGTSRSTEDLLLLFGDDPDPLFLKECWALGAPAAVKRRHARAECERQSRAFRELDRSVLNLYPVEPSDMHSYFADRAASIASHYDASWSRPQPAAPAADPEDRPQAWVPQDWTPEDRSRQRWIPHGWLPKEVTRLDDAPQSDPAATSILRACELLGVTPQTTPAEVRSAYRRRVVQCHPDRQQHAPEAVRRQANRRLADLNDAYRLLRTTHLERAA